MPRRRPSIRPVVGHDPRKGLANAGQDEQGSLGGVPRRGRGAGLQRGLQTLTSGRLLKSLNPAGDGRGNDGRNWFPSRAGLRYCTGRPWPGRGKRHTGASLVLMP